MKTEVIKREDILSILTDDYENLDYGGSVPASAVSAWGARAIWANKKIELLQDRQAAIAGSDVCQWLNSNGMTKKLETALNENWITERDDDYIHIEDGLFHMLASPNASYGYLYIVAWKDSDELKDQK